MHAISQPTLSERPNSRIVVGGGGGEGGLRPRQQQQRPEQQGQQQEEQRRRGPDGDGTVTRGRPATWDDEYYWDKLTAIFTTPISVLFAFAVLSSVDACCAVTFDLVKYICSRTPALPLSFNMLCIKFTLLTESLSLRCMRQQVLK